MRQARPAGREHAEALTALPALHRDVAQPRGGAGVARAANVQRGFQW